MEAYTVLSKLGQGACGSVFLVQGTDGGRFALKRVGIERLSAAERKAILREVQLLSQLKHPNIIGYEDAFTDCGDMCMLMAVADGGTLDGRLQRAKESGQALDQAWVLDCLVQLCSSVHYLHSCRILHRDIKPANILLAADGTPRLADFGISIPMISDERQLGRVLHGDSADQDRAPDVLRSKTLEGTPLYLAPELFSPALEVVNAQYSTASDVWALGVCLYEMVALHRPYESQSLYSLAYKLCRDLGQNAMTDWLAEKELEQAAAGGAPNGGSASSVASASVGYDRHVVLAIEGMLHKRPRQRATLSEVLDRQAIALWRESRNLPLSRTPVELSADDANRPLPDVLQWGRGARLPRPREDLSGVLVTAIACGASHAAAVSEAGALYTWGSSPHGQLGHGDRATLSRRRRVLGLMPHRVAAVACGRAHTLALTANGEAFGWGSNESGQLGLSDLPLGGLDAMRCALSPLPLAAPAGGSEGWAGVACGEAHSAAVSTSGHLFTWGRNEDGRLGLGGDSGGDGEVGVPARAPNIGDVVGSPRRVQGLPCPVSSVDCGDCFTVALGADGRAYGFGGNWMGQLGLNPETDEFVTPTRLLASVKGRIVHVSCGAEHMAAMTEDGHLWVCGGRFGAPAAVPVPGPLPDQAADGAPGDGRCWWLVACGSECVIACTGAGGCYAWGDGAHGRLGLGDEAERDAPAWVAQLSTHGACGTMEEEGEKAQGQVVAVGRRSEGVVACALACGRGVSSGCDEGPLMLAVVTTARAQAEISGRVKAGCVVGSFRTAGEATPALTLSAVLERESEGLEECDGHCRVAVGGTHRALDG